MGQRVEEFGARLRDFLFDRHRVKLWVSGLILISVSMGWINPQTAAVLEEINERIEQIDVQLDGVSDVTARTAAAAMARPPPPDETQTETIARQAEQVAVFDAALMEAEDELARLNRALNNVTQERDNERANAVAARAALDDLRSRYNEEFICFEHADWNDARQRAELLCGAE